MERRGRGSTGSEELGGRGFGGGQTWAGARPVPASNRTNNARRIRIVFTPLEDPPDHYFHLYRELQRVGLKEGLGLVGIFGKETKRVRSVSEAALVRPSKLVEICEYSVENLLAVRTPVAKEPGIAHVLERL